MQSENFTKIKLLFEIFEIICPNAKFSIDKKIWKMVSINDHQTACIQFDMDSNECMIYNTKEQQNFDMDLSLIIEGLSDVRGDYNMTLHISENKKKFNLKLKNENTEIDYSQNIINNDKPVQDYSNLCKANLIISFDMIEFMNICDEFSEISVYVTISYSNNNLSFKSSNNNNYTKSYSYSYDETTKTFSRKTIISNLDKYDKSYKEKTDHYINIIENTDEEISSVYIVNDLLSLKRCHNISNSIKIYLSNDYPLMITFPVGKYGNVICGFSPLKNNEKNI
jgi:hypothetical protein